MAFETPILLIVFNRPDTTIEVFNKIKILKPKKLFIAADGPRTNKPGEIEKCDQSRKIAQLVDWDCEVKTLFRENNLGCKVGVSSAITWFFQNVNEGIILEDDCVPNESFFKFCSEILEKYRNDERIMHISGTNLHKKKMGNESYFFSRYNHVWGWATWKRAWDLYDVKMLDYPEFIKNERMQDIFSSKAERKVWRKIFATAFADRIDTWDFQWEYAILKNNGLCITPNKNFVSNIGFRNDATHTKGGSFAANLPQDNIEMITHPKFIIANSKADTALFRKVYYQGLFKKIINKFRVFLKV